jgi:hypothetical protein
LAPGLSVSSPTPSPRVTAAVIPVTVPPTPRPTPTPVPPTRTPAPGKPVSFAVNQVTQNGAALSITATYIGDGDLSQWLGTAASLYYCIDASGKKLGSDDGFSGVLQMSKVMLSGTSSTVQLSGTLVALWIYEPSIAWPITCAAMTLRFGFTTDGGVHWGPVFDSPPLAAPTRWDSGTVSIGKCSLPGCPEGH